MDRIELALHKLFERHRIVFWYDTKRELRSEFESISLPNIEKLEIQNNQFLLKYRMLREHPKRKFLLYHHGPQPEDHDNWLLDIQLASEEFRTDQSAIWLDELGLDFEFTHIAQRHPYFFKQKQRREALKRLLKPEDDSSTIQLKLLAVCAGSGPLIEEILHSVLSDLVQNRIEKMELLENCKLDDYLFQQMKRQYGYESSEPSLQDFLIQLFSSCYAMGLSELPRLTPDSVVFLKRWKDSRQFEKGFEVASQKAAEMLGMAEDLQTRDYRKLAEIDYFELVDKKILSDLALDIANKTISSADCSALVRQRRQSHWYASFEHEYQALDFSSQFFVLLSQLDLTIDSMSDGVHKYCNSWFKVDQLYRKIIFHASKSGQTSLTGPIVEQVENLYCNNYLVKLNNNWQTLVDLAKSWNVPGITSQNRFFENWVRPFTVNDKRVIVIISDALRYEIGEELFSLIRQEDKYEGTLEPAISMLPSYTQLGMAALLPNKELKVCEDDQATAYVDGLSSRGTENRTKILNVALPQRATAIQARDILDAPRDDLRTLIKDNDVIYVYHNRIDSTGDKRDTEERVFDASEETLQELIKLIKKLAANNVYNFIVTADHGFIYQNRPIEESDFSGAEVSGVTVSYYDRRFVLGKGLVPHTALRKFRSADAGLTGELEMQIPKSITRLRLKGSGSRFVHGGASLQEVIIPVLQINKKRQSDVTLVGVDMIRSGSSLITSGQLSVAFYQTEAVTEKVRPRILRAGIYTQSGTLISDSHELTFDFDSENPRERERPIRFVLTREADQANGQEVILRLDEKILTTSQYRHYKSQKYTVRRSFTSDFDF